VSLLPSNFRWPSAFHNQGARFDFRWKFRLEVALAMGSIALAASLCGCGFSSGGSSIPPQNVSVTVSPQNATVLLGKTVQFTATVTAAASDSVNWSVNDVAGGNSAVGTISASGLYTAPQTIPSNPIVTITATTQSAPHASGSATVKIQSGVAVSIAVSITPNSASVAPGGNVTFSATVSGAGSASAAVNWSVVSTNESGAGLGAISASGADAAVYTAPASPPPQGPVSVVATSVADPSKSATATVTISCAAVNAISPASASVTVGASQTFTASLCIAPGAVIAWQVNGIAGGNSSVGTITSTGASIANYTAPAAVPSPASVKIEATAGTQSATATVSIVASASISVTVSPASATVITGQSANFTASVSNTSNSAVTWTVNGVPNGNGTVGQVCAPASNPCAAPSGPENTVEYLAPAVQPQPDSVTLVAISQADSSATGSAQITVTAPAQPGINLVPFYAFIGPSEQFQFTATVTGEANAGVTWSLSSAVAGQGCSGASCGSIDNLGGNSGNYTAPAAAPSPNAILITATSAANPSFTATATVAITSGPTIETILPSSVIAGAQQSFLLALEGLNFIPTTTSGNSQILINNSPRTTNCPTPNLCTVTLQPSDVAAAGALSVEIENPGDLTTLSNPVSLVILPAPQPPSAISLTSTAPVSAGNNIVVVEPTTAGATTSPINIEFVGMVSADGSTCTIQDSAIPVTRPTSGTTNINICAQGNLLDPTFTYSFSSPNTGGDIGITTASMESLFPNLIELTLTISSQTAAGLRTLFVTTPNGDIATATGVLEVQ
jgi:hypothetical protein